MTWWFLHNIKTDIVFNNALYCFYNDVENYYVIPHINHGWSRRLSRPASKIHNNSVRNRLKQCNVCLPFTLTLKTILTCICVPSKIACAQHLCLYPYLDLLCVQKGISSELIFNFKLMVVRLKIVRQITFSSEVLTGDVTAISFQDLNF